MTRIKHIKTIASALALSLAALVPLWMAGCGGAAEDDLPPDMSRTRVLGINPSEASVIGQDNASDTVIFRIRNGAPPFWVYLKDDATDRFVLDKKIKVDDDYNYKIDPSAWTSNYSYEILVKDSAGNEATARLFVAKARDLELSAPSDTIDANAGTGDTITFYIKGGSGKIDSILSSNIALLNPPALPLTSNTFDIDPADTAISNTVTISVSDSLGQTASADISLK